MLTRNELKNIDSQKYKQNLTTKSLNKYINDNNINTHKTHKSEVD